MRNMVFRFFSKNSVIGRKSFMLYFQRTKTNEILEEYKGSQLSQLITKQV